MRHFGSCIGVARSIVIVVCALFMQPSGADAGDRQLLWGDTHLHSSNSFDAFLNRNMSADPATAYRYAKGLPVIHPFNRARAKIDTPLDFLVVADHAEYLGVVRHVVERGVPRDGLGPIQRFRAWMAERWLRGVIEKDRGMSAFTSVLPDSDSVEEAAARPPGTQIENADMMSRTTWDEATAAADAHYEPGRFTTLIGWEWSSIPAGANLHRVVFTSAGAEVAQRFRPYSSVDSAYPEDLWAWLDATSKETGAEFVSIPHNSNISKGYMFGDKSLRGVAINPDYAQLRVKWEPIVEATQIKGDSETHPALSPDDPFADFETYTHYIEQNPKPYKAQAADYVRSGLLRGLAIGDRVGVNPYRFGLIGSTDSHSGLASAEEANFWGKMARDSIPENKRGGWGRSGGPTGWAMSASGLAAVWAEANTRESILAAFKRREVYATTGPRIVVRVFGGWDIDPDADSMDADELKADGAVPMGAVLSGAAGRVPRFLVRALRDPKGANLDRVQIIKGWLDEDGQTRERVYDVAWSGDRAAGPDGAIGPVGNTVDRATGVYSNAIGSAELVTVWEDPSFDASQASFYYVRVLQIPTPRHSLLDAIALGVDIAETGKPWAIQERAYTSPIWYDPS